MTPLRRRMLEDMQVRQLSSSTQRMYVSAVARFARHFGRSPARLGPEKVRAYQVHLTNERRLARSTLIVYVSALRFLYRVTLNKTIVRISALQIILPSWDPGPPPAARPLEQKTGKVRTKVIGTVTSENASAFVAPNKAADAKLYTDETGG